MSSTVAARRPCDTLAACCLHTVSAVLLVTGHGIEEQQRAQLQSLRIQLVQHKAELFAMQRQLQVANQLLLLEQQERLKERQQASELQCIQEQLLEQSEARHQAAAVLAAKHLQKYTAARFSRDCRQDVALVEMKARKQCVRRISLARALLDLDTDCDVLLQALARDAAAGSEEGPTQEQQAAVDQLMAPSSSNPPAGYI